MSVLGLERNHCARRSLCLPVNPWGPPVSQTPLLQSLWLQWVGIGPVGQCTKTKQRFQPLPRLNRSWGFGDRAAKLVHGVRMQTWDFLRLKLKLTTLNQRTLNWSIEPYCGLPAKYEMCWVLRESGSLREDTSFPRILCAFLSGREGSTITVRHYFLMLLCWVEGILDAPFILLAITINHTESLTL